MAPVGGPGRGGKAGWQPSQTETTRLGLGIWDSQAGPSSLSLGGILAPSAHWPKLSGS